MTGIVALAQVRARHRAREWACTAVPAAMNVDHLRLQLDELEHRAEVARDALDKRRIVVECVALERAIVTVEEGLERDIAMLEAVRQRLRRLRARG